VGSFPDFSSRLLCAFLVIPSSILAQAWLSPKGEGTVSLNYQNQYVADHVFENADAHDIGHILSHALRGCHKINRTFSGGVEGSCSSTLHEARRARFGSTPLPRLIP